MGSSTQTQNTSSSTSPWAPQASALTTAFNGASAAYNGSLAAKAPTDFTAQFTPEQLGSFRSMLNYSNGNNIPGQQADNGNALMGSGTAATQGALTGLANYNPSSANNTATILNSAHAYADGQNIDGQVNDAMQNAREQARDVTMPGIEQNAATSGNTNSSRTGLADGLVQRGLAEQATNIGATLRNNAFQNGLTLAENQAQSNNALGLGALTTAASAGTSAAGTGAGMGTSSINNQGSLFNMANMGGAGLQAGNQANLTNQLQQYQFGTSAPFEALRNYMSIVGSGNWGSSSTGQNTTTSTPSAWSIIGGLLGGAGSAASTAGSLGWQPFSSSPTYGTGAAGSYEYPQYH